MQLNKSRAGALHVYWQIAYTPKRQNEKRFGKFSFLLHSLVEMLLKKREKIFSPSHTNFPYFIPFFRIGKSFFLFLLLVLEKFSINTLTILSVVLCFSLEKTFLALPIYRMRGLTDFARTSPLRLGKKLLEIFDWLTPFFPPLLVYSLRFALNRFFVCCFGPVIKRSIFTDSDSAAAIKKEREKLMYTIMCSWSELSIAFYDHARFSICD
jgi:hypothetical protein